MRKKKTAFSRWVPLIIRLYSRLGQRCKMSQIKIETNIFNENIPLSLGFNTVFRITRSLLNALSTMSALRQQAFCSKHIVHRHLVSFASTSSTHSRTFIKD